MNQLELIHAVVTIRQQAVYDAQKALDLANTRLEEALSKCGDPECYTCSMIACPYGHFMHYHHDGCPACAGAFEGEQ